ncbi:MAG: hypothetical protein MJ156_03245 [Alphaproteobacteria bacterium]|nr:hypothetical protein [Alphaproteobacteria bacterium]
MENILVIIITSIIAPILLLCFQEFMRYLRNKKHNVLKEIEKGVLELKKDTLRLQILNLIQHDPKNTAAINHLYDEYVNPPYSGNSYLRSVYLLWSQKYEHKKAK